MRLDDQFGYALTINGAEAVAEWNAVANAFLAHGKATPGHLTACLGHDPDFALGHATRGIFCLLLARREMLATAEECLSIARASAREHAITDREQSVVRALETWLRGFPTHAADLLDEALARAPRDALLLKLVHQIRFLLGDASGMRRSVEQAMSAYDESHPAYGYILGCRAFALEETGDYRAAEASGRQGLDHAADDAWGLHAVAHVHDMTGRPEEGIGWLESHPGGWDHCNNFGYHVWWHLALMYLDRGEADKALALYDSDIRRDRTDDFRDISNGASLLTRLELEGINVGARWEELALLSDKRAEDGCNVFADLHYLLALLNGGRRMGAERLISGLKQRAALETDIGPVSALAGVPAALGLEQYRKGNYASAFAQLMAARDKLPSIGGSHAQRDVFERITVDAALRAGLADDAERLILDRTHRRGAPDRFGDQRMQICERMRRASRIMSDERLRATGTV